MALEKMWRAAFEFTEGWYRFGKEATLTQFVYYSGANGNNINEEKGS